MLNLAAARDVHTEPYHWATVVDLLPPDTRAELAKGLPDLGRFTRAERKAGGDKLYGMFVLPLVEGGERTAALDEVGPAWTAFVDAVQGPEYRAWVADTVGADVSTSTFDVGVFVFGAGDWVSSHTDKVGKLATHVVYLNDTWGAGDGGEFLVRGEAGDDAPVHSAITPGDGRSVLFARSDNSWHAVAPVAPSAPELRITAQVEMYR